MVPKKLKKHLFIDWDKIVLLYRNMLCSFTAGEHWILISIDTLKVYFKQF